MLAVEDELWGPRLGRELVHFVEDMWRERGVKKIQLEILTPRNWVCERKEVLKAWYERKGYVLVKVGRLEDLDGTEVFVKQVVNLRS